MRATSKLNRMLLLWLVSVIVLNIIWSNVAQMNAVQELNEFDRDVDEISNVTISKFFNSEKSMPVEIHTETRGGENSGETFAWSLTDPSGEEIYSWSGDYNTTIPAWKGELSPGLYTVTIERPDFVSVKQFANITPLEAHETTIRVVLNLGLILVALVDFVVRRKISDFSKKRPERKMIDITPSSFKKLTSYDEVNDFDDSSDPWRDPIIES